MVVSRIASLARVLCQWVKMGFSGKAFFPGLTFLGWDLGVGRTAAMITDQDTSCFPFFSFGLFMHPHPYTRDGVVHLFSYSGKIGKHHI
jgi:hypothetical protein